MSETSQTFKDGMNLAVGLMLGQMARQVALHGYKPDMMEAFEQVQAFGLEIAKTPLGKIGELFGYETTDRKVS